MLTIRQVSKIKCEVTFRGNLWATLEKERGNWVFHQKVMKGISAETMSELGKALKELNNRN